MKTALIFLAVFLLSQTALADINISRTFEPSALPTFQWQSKWFDYDIFIRQNANMGGFIYLNHETTSAFALDFNNSYWLTKKGVIVPLSGYQASEFPIIPSPTIRFGYKNIYPKIDANLSLANYPLISYRINKPNWAIKAIGQFLKGSLNIQNNLVLKPNSQIWVSGENKTGKDFETTDSIYFIEPISKKIFYQFQKPLIFDSKGKQFQAIYVVKNLSANKISIIIQIPAEILFDKKNNYPLFILGK